MPPWGAVRSSYWSSARPGAGLVPGRNAGPSNPASPSLRMTLLLVGAEEDWGVVTWTCWGGVVTVTSVAVRWSVGLRWMVPAGPLTVPVTGTLEVLGA